jgi:cytochrome b561
MTATQAHRNGFRSMSHDFAPSDDYTRTAIALHWLIALLMVCAFALGWVMTGIHGITPAKLRYYSWHKWLGVTVFGLAVLRVAWRATHRSPALPPGMPRWQRAAARGAHVLLYVLMFAVPLTGYLFSCAANVPVVYLGLVRLPMLIGPDPVMKPVLRGLHVALNYTLAALVVAHVLAAFKHQWLDGDGLLARMIPLLKRGRS